MKNNFSKACLEKLSLKMTETCYGNLLLFILITF